MPLLESKRRLRNAAETLETMHVSRSLAGEQNECGALTRYETVWITWGLDALLQAERAEDAKIPEGVNPARDDHLDGTGLNSEDALADRGHSTGASPVRGIALPWVDSPLRMRRQNLTKAAAVQRTLRLALGQRETQASAKLLGRKRRQTFLERPKGEAQHANLTRRQAVLDAFLLGKEG